MTKSREAIWDLLRAQASRPCIVFAVPILSCDMSKCFDCKTEHMKNRMQLEN